MADETAMVHAAPGSIAVVFGTRPEAIKLAKVIRLLGPAARTIHSGQHFTPEMARFIHDDLGLEVPTVQLEVGGASRGRQIGQATTLLDEYLARHPATAVVVQGDTNTALAGALAANAREVHLVHVEAGLRSHDRRMPEEHNRVLVDHLADLACAPTEIARSNLLAEGIDEERLIVTGNTVVDAVIELLPPPAERHEILSRYSVTPSAYVLATFHRPENVDDPQALGEVLDGLAALPLPVLLPLHPRTDRRAREFQLQRHLEQLRVTSPIGYRDFLALIDGCAVVVSDSGGIQEEASVLKRPVVVVRNSTERPEVQGTFAILARPNQIATAAGRWLDDVTASHAKLAPEPCPFGDGTAAEQTVRAIERLLSAQ
jgi:UDP-N-acetylglucosamine 2-epimerase (non-hydrolysing)